MTTTLDLGALDGPVLLCGGAYSNFEAAEALLAFAASHGIGASHIIHSGDVVAYCADPGATTARLMETGIRAIRGNVEIQLADGAADCGCGFAEGTACAAMSGAWYGHAASALARQVNLVEWMGQLPDRIAFTLSGCRILVVHGAVSAVNRHIFASTDKSLLREEFGLAGGEFDAILAGHSGLPFSRVVDGRLWHNSGALGMPANDGTPRVWVSLLTPKSDSVCVHHHPLRYDHATAAAKMRRAGLPEGYAAALECGLWPSLDTLPQAERQLTGRPADPAAAQIRSAT